MSAFSSLLFFVLAALLGLFVGGFGSSIWWIVGSMLIVIAAFAEAWLSRGAGLLGAALIVIGYNSGLLGGILFGQELLGRLGRFRRTLLHDQIQDKSERKKSRPRTR